jgi:predicted DNA-binding protein (UPF0251 family)
MSEDRARILQMVSEGKISAVQGAELLNAMRSNGEPDAAPTPTGGKANWLRVRVTNLETGRAKVNVNLPFSLVRAGLKIGGHFAPEMKDIDWEELLAAIDEGAAGKLVDVEDIESGEKVEVFVD